MKSKIKNLFVALAGVTCFVAMASLQTFAASPDTNAAALEQGICSLEEKYNVTIKKAPTARNAESMSAEEVNDTLQGLEATLAEGQKAREENQRAYEAHMQELQESGRMDDVNDTSETIVPRNLASRFYFQSIGQVVPNGTIIRCSMTGTTMNDPYGNVVWRSLSSHSSSLNSGYGSDWNETDFSYNRMDAGRTYNCSFIGTLEEPYMSSGAVQYYVYSEGWRIWFEAYSKG